MKLVAHSWERWNGGVKAKRQYGSSTMTEFVVYRAEDEKNASLWVYVITGGKTPGERKTAAIKQAESLLRTLLESKGIVP